MALPVFQSMQHNTRINMVTLMQVGGVTRFNGYTYLGLLPYAVAAVMQGQDPQALVMATRAYFRPGSPERPEDVSFVAVRADNNSPTWLVPEPLIQAESVQSVSKVTHIITVEDSLSREQLSVILSSNGVSKFNIRTETS